jgi:hypothetical protein
LETGLTGFSTDSGLNFYKCADSPIHPPLGDIKILSPGRDHPGATPTPLAPAGRNSRPAPPSSKTGAPSLVTSRPTELSKAARQGRPRACSRPAAPPPSSLTNEDHHYSDRPPPPQRGVAAFPLRGHSGRLHEESLPTAPRRTGTRQPEVNAMIFSPTTIDGHRSSWSSNIFARTAFPRL